MIQTYHLLDGGQITASSPEEFVRLLREGSRFDYDCTDQEYMENFAPALRGAAWRVSCHRYP